MRTQFSRIAFAIAFAFGLCFAQERLAVYVSGSGDAGINKSLGIKLLAAMTQSGEYSGIIDQGSFHDELSKVGISQISQAAKRHGADYVCAVDMVEVFGAYSISVRLIKIASSQVVKTGSTDRPLKSLDDLTTVSNELARQLLPSTATLVPPPAAAAPVVVAPIAAIAVPPAETAPPLAEIYAPVAEQKRCARTYNINEILFKIKNGFPSKLKDCSSTLAKDMLNPFGKKLEPKSFMVQCAVDGIKNELPEGFSNVDKVIASLTNFVQGLMNSASAGGSLDPKKLVSLVGSMDVGGLLSDVKTIAATAECIVDEPYEPPSVPVNDVAESYSDDEGGKSELSFGIRFGFNGSHTYTEYKTRYGYDSGDYGDIGGIQLGVVLDIAATDWFHIQPGLMYIQKGRHDNGNDITAHYIEFPLLLSLKLSAFRFSAGPYFGGCFGSDAWVFDDGLDAGLSTGVGFDIGMFYIGMFWNYGIADMSGKSGYEFYNRTVGLNLGVNL
ncbi:MAG: PorT family protein [Fibromonadaceae bacterium]|jgi:hypothetical protein|nr:PorT family protein [Fibromonadaceae bacterium]